MAKMALKVVLLTAALAGASASSDDGEVTRKAISELEGMIRRQREQIAALRAQGKARRLADDAAALPPSLHPSASTRSYTDEENLEIAMDHLWLILCGTLVMFMQAGFAMVEAGCCRFKNVQNVLLKNLTDVCVGTLGWYFLGWGFAYGGPLDKDGKLVGGFAGTQMFAGTNFAERKEDGQIEPSASMMNWYFQWAFCSAAATIVSGGVAERVNFPGYLVFSFFMSSFIYPIVVAWTWGYGWLHSVNEVGTYDFAGSGIVHVTGGVGALVGAAMAGPRAGRFEGLSWVRRLGEAPEDFSPHSIVLVVFGTFSLWFGWYGFNCGSTLSMHTTKTGQLAAQVAMNTTIAAATGGLFVFAIRYVMIGRFDVIGFCNGILAGLVSITAGCANMTCGSAAAAAALGAFVFQMASSALRALRIDDPVDAFAVHGACGAWGVVAAAFFDWGDGLGLKYINKGSFECIHDAIGNCAEGLAGNMIANAFLEITMILVWVGATSGIIFGVLKMTKLLVASSDMQETGFDILKHSPSKAYDLGEEEPYTSI